MVQKALHKVWRSMVRMGNARSQRTSSDSELAVSTKRISKTIRKIQLVVQECCSRIGVQGPVLKLSFNKDDESGTCVQKFDSKSSFLHFYSFVYKTHFTAPDQVALFLESRRNDTYQCKVKIGMDLERFFTIIEKFPDFRDMIKLKQGFADRIMRINYSAGLREQLNAEDEDSNYDS